MSEEQRSGEKTEQPTSHRLREARRKGQVVRSTELNSALNLLAMVLLMMLFGDVFFNWSISTVHEILDQKLLYNLSKGNIAPLSLDVISGYFRLIGIIFFTLLAAGLIVNYAQVGFVFSMERLSPSLDKLNPVEGLKRIFSRRALFELVKAIIKICLVGLVAYLFISSRLENLIWFTYLAPASFLAVYSREICNLALRVGVVFLALAVLDYIYQRYEYFKSLRMSIQEVKEENKQLEGDPLIKSKLREKQRNIVNQRMLTEVAGATVVITNPTELAVALRYREEETPAPRVVAKGAGLMAARIKEKARENRVPIVENKTVARFLYRRVEVGRDIPVELYQTVAEILALVYKLNKQK